MWSYMHIFAPDEFPSARDFTRRFTGFRQAAGQFKMSIDAEKLFRSALKGRLIRRTAAEVGLQLPQVIREDVYLEFNELQGEIYKQMKEQFFIWLDQTTRPLTANNINTLKLDERDSSKLDEAVRRILEHDTQTVGFCCFNEPLNELAFRLQVEGKSVAIISSATSNEMGTYERDFQAGKLDVLLINSAMGEGLNLHRDPEKWAGGAGYGFTLDRWYNNARNDQCFKRIVRPGAPGPIFFDDFYVQNSVDEYIRILCDEKDEMFNNVTENASARPSGDWKQYLEGLL
jgi:SNF2 family DNA or RNA helicase